MTAALAEWFSLDGRVVLVTGASSGLGASFASTFAEAGADVVLAARRVERLHDTATSVRAHGRRALTVATDVSAPEQCEAAVARTMDEFGRLDVLVNNAGVAHAIPATRETPEQFRSVIDVNLNGSFWMAQACGRVMQPGSSIINISSVLAVTTAGLPQAAYSASKAALSGLTRDLASQWGRRKGIRVNALAPGFFASEMTEAYSQDYVQTTLMPRLLVGRVGHPMELTTAAVWLASPASGFTTGQTIVVDGGMSVT